MHLWKFACLPSEGTADELVIQERADTEIQGPRLNLCQRLREKKTNLLHPRAVHCKTRSCSGELSLCSPQSHRLGKAVCSPAVCPMRVMSHQNSNFTAAIRKNAAACV